MLYLTYNDQPSGVFSSQVNDVCNFLNRNLDADIKLVAFISMRGFSENKLKIKKEVPSAWVLPAIPKAKYWRFNAFIFAFVCLITGERNIIARNIIATHLALFAKSLGLAKKICLDGRGAIAAEWNEYQVVPDENMKKAISGQEKKAVLESNFHIAVSSKLVDYWRDSFGYKDSSHVVIPCTLNSGFRPAMLPEEEIKKLREKEGYADQDIVMVYSGSTAGWQSFSVLEALLGKVLDQGPQFKLLFMANEDESIKRMKQKYPSQVTNKWVQHKDVQNVLAACDFGILFREQSVTNKVASPTKFAEYLAAGLPVIISEGLGDYSDFVRQNNCGRVTGPGDNIVLNKPAYSEKIRMTQLVEKHFTKEANKNTYRELVNFMKG